MFCAGTSLTRWVTKKSQSLRDVSGGFVLAKGITNITRLDHVRSICKIQESQSRGCVLWTARSISNVAGITLRHAGESLLWILTLSRRGLGGRSLLPILGTVGDAQVRSDYQRRQFGFAIRKYPSADHRLRRRRRRKTSPQQCATGQTSLQDQWKIHAPRGVALSIYPPG